MPIRLKDLIKKVPRETETIVKRARDRTRATLQEALRAECRLSLRTPEETEKNKHGAQVPLGVAPGHPEFLEEMEFPDDLERALLIGRYRFFLEQARTGTKGLLPLPQSLSGLPNAELWLKVSNDQLQSIVDWANLLLKELELNDPLNFMRAFNEDILGAYQYDSRGIFENEYLVNRASIRIYWGIIGLVSEWLGCTVEDLTIVVLTHELAHAYTQLGADIGGRRWPASLFAKAETSLKEGLAQYYTERVLQRLKQKYSGALQAYEKMLPMQSKAYQTHRPWIADCSSEAVRRAMLEIRSWKEGRLSNFESRLALSQKELHPD
jgi:hypothetical protein